MAASLPAWPVVISTALVDSVNPCAIGVLVILIATLLKLSHDKKKMAIVGAIYVTSVFVAYLAAGLGLIGVINQVAQLFGMSVGDLQSILGWVVGLIVIAMALVEIKDFFWYGQGFSLQIPKKHAKRIMHFINNITIPGSIVLGFFVAAVELPCTGGPYLGILTILAREGITFEVFSLLVVYNIIFVLPLIIILLLVFFGADADKIKDWKDDKKKWMRLFMGLVMLILGVLLILNAQGIIRFA